MVILLWASLALTAIFFMDTWYGRVILLAVAIGVSIHILTIKTEPEHNPQERLEHPSVGDLAPAEDLSGKLDDSPG